MRFLINLVTNAFAIWVVTLFTALEVTVTAFPPGETLQYVISLLVIALIFAIVNTFVGTIVKILALPLYIITFGLISLVINGFLLWFTAWITSFWGWGLSVGNFWHTILAALIIALINWIVGIFLRPKTQGAADHSPPPPAPPPPPGWPGSLTRAP